MESRFGRPLALAALIVVSPLRAAVVEPVSLAPALGMVQSVPGFQASVMTQIQLAASLSGQPAATISLSPLTTAIAADDEHQKKPLVSLVPHGQTPVLRSFC